LKKSHVLCTKRSFFTRKSMETSQLPASEISHGMSEMSRSTLTAEEAGLQELVKQNMVMVLGEDRSGGNKGKSGLRFWKGSEAKTVVA
jgi:hypothetical protein